MESNLQIRAALAEHTGAIRKLQSEAAKAHAARASCHQALGDLPSAWHDARMCLYYARTDPQSYKLAVTVLLEMKRYSQAQEVIADGYKCVENDLHHTNLKAVLDRLGVTIEAATRCDPFSVLPDELKIRVLEHISFKTAIKIRQVCRLWRDLINNTPECWSDVDFIGTYAITDEFVQRTIQRAHGRITNCALKYLKDSDEILLLLRDHCAVEGIRLEGHDVWLPRFVQLFEGSKHLKRVYFRMFSYPENMLWMMRLASCLRNQIESLEFHDREPYPTPAVIDQEPITKATYPKLRSLHFTTWRIDFTSMRNGGPEIIAARLRNLQQLRIHFTGCYITRVHNTSNEDFQHFHNLRHLTLSWNVLGPLQHVGLILPHQLKTLRLNTVPPGVWEQLELPDLEELIIPMRDINSLTKSLLPSDHSAIAGVPRLRRLILMGWNVRSVQDALMLAEICHHPRLSNLVELALLYAHGVERRSVALDVEHLERLELLDLSGGWLHDSIIVAALRAPNLKRLALPREDDVTQETIDEVKQRGLLQPYPREDDLYHFWDS